MSPIDDKPKPIITKNTTIVLTSVFVILVVILVISGILGKKEQTNQDKNQSSTVGVTQESEVIETKNNEKPIGFPDNLPLNGQTKTIESYNVKSPNPKTKQASIVFNSSNTIEENYDFYRQWGKDNSWQITNSTDQEKTKSVYLEKGREDINIIITKNQGDQSQVGITWVFI